MATPQSLEPISELADYSALKKLANALWRQDTAYHGAAIMVGAGFSRSAAVSGDPKRKLPVWFDLANALNAELGPNAGTDPLRLAEEYQAYFGRPALNALIKSQINDLSWTPGPLYHRLLELPWSDVLTTNWDTLLERAAKEVYQPVYSSVIKQQDLAGAHAPRIVKLHGTIGAADDFVFTQEDYRKYSNERGAYVNLARQVFVENELCLLGFSGDDPNFLQWTGWVRDHLTSSARRIFLVGALNLSAPKRKYLESMNVAPVDLWPLVAHYDDENLRHSAATVLFINALYELRAKASWDWTPHNFHRPSYTEEELDRTHRNAKYAASLLEGQLPRLKADRQSYPGWLVAPPLVRSRLENQISDPYPTAAALAELHANSRAELLYEISWRYGVSQRPLSPWMVEELLAICNPDIPCSLSKRQQLEIAVHLLKHTRQMDADSETQAIRARLEQSITKHRQHWPEATAELAYQKALAASERLRYGEVEPLLSDIDGRDPAWKLRRASLLAELGRFDEGEALVLEAYRDLLRQHREDRNSVYVVSRLAWAHWLKRAAQVMKMTQWERLPSLYKDFRSDPFELIDNMEEEIAAELKAQREHRGITPSFDAGSYKDNSRKVRFNGRTPPTYSFSAIASEVGIPLSWNNVQLLVGAASELVRLEDIDAHQRALLAIRATHQDSSAILAACFSRVQVACIPGDVARTLRQEIIGAIDYLRQALGDKPSHATYIQQKIGVFLEVLGRLAVLAEPDEATALFKSALLMGQDRLLQNHRVAAPLGTLLTNALASIPESNRSDLLLATLCFPLTSEAAMDRSDRWPNPIIKDRCARSSDPQLSKRIAEIIEQVTARPATVDALMRLLPLVEHDILLPQESEKLAAAIWSLPKGSDDLPKTGLYKYVLAKLPSVDGVLVRAQIKEALFQSGSKDALDEDTLVSIANAAALDALPIVPTPEEAVEMFDRLIQWRPPRETHPFAFIETDNANLGEAIGEALGRSLVPAMAVEDLTEERFRGLIAFDTETDSPSVALSIAGFARGHDERISSAVKLLRERLQDSRANRVAYASYAALRWRETCDAPAVQKLISRLIHLVANGRTPGLAAQLWSIGELLKQDKVSREDVETLGESIPIIYANTDYASIDGAGADAVSVSLVRAACVRLAAQLVALPTAASAELLDLLRAARTDSLPEVRFAASGGGDT